MGHATTLPSMAHVATLSPLQTVCANVVPHVDPVSQQGTVPLEQMPVAVENVAVNTTVVVILFTPADFGVYSPFDSCYFPTIFVLKKYLVHHIFYLSLLCSY